jgi:hypothetical protein
LPDQVGKYTIRYGVVSPKLISNEVIVKNPAYGKPIGNWGSRPVCPPKSSYRLLEEKNQFYTRLEASILKDGIRNPIFCNAYSHGTYCRYGTSRLWIAKRHNIDVPVVIADYANNWDHLEALGQSDVELKFKDIPAIIEFGADEMRIDGCKHTHLEDTENV